MKRPFKKKSTEDSDDSLPLPPSQLSRPPGLPPPPVFSQDIVSRPPFPETPVEPLVSGSGEEKEPLPVPDDLTDDILYELRTTGFSSILEHVPEEERPPPTVDEVESARYLAAKDDYLSAANKHLELQFYENAAYHFTCAVLCIFLAKDVFEAAHVIADMASKLPGAVTNSSMFQGCRLLLKANLVENTAFLVQAEKWLLHNTTRLYKEDEELIKRALRLSELNIL
ncbi:MAG: hypothetical protein JSV04_06950 [Candidatus Heimdallarchaeota archaeon]|nr:MAG: hypothetical protein JSV04_06950 [Candidatus Heimdallarchaeota archaeon]